MLICVPGRCRDYHCASLNPSPPGSSCQENFDCQGFSLCIGGTCDDSGTICLALDNSPTGNTNDCRSGKYGHRKNHQRKLKLFLVPSRLLSSRRVCFLSSTRDRPNLRFRRRLRWHRKRERNPSGMFWTSWYDRVVWWRNGQLYSRQRRVKRIKRYLRVW